jgi:hypothetical protein
MIYPSPKTVFSPACKHRTGHTQPDMPHVVQTILPDVLHEHNALTGTRELRFVLLQGTLKMNFRSIEISYLFKFSGFPHPFVKNLVINILR